MTSDGLKSPSLPHDFLNQVAMSLIWQQHNPVRQVRFTTECIYPLCKVAPRPLPCVNACLVLYSSFCDGYCKDLNVQLVTLKLKELFV